MSKLPDDEWLEKISHAPYREFIPVRQLDDGTVIGVQQMITTWGLFVNIDEIGYERRYCYEHCTEAVIDCISWDGVGDPPGNWLKEKPSDRLGPGLTR